VNSGGGNSGGPYRQCTETGKEHEAVGGGGALVVKACRAGVYFRSGEQKNSVGWRGRQKEQRALSEACSRYITQAEKLGTEGFFTARWPTGARVSEHVAMVSGLEVGSWRAEDGRWSERFDPGLAWSDHSFDQEIHWFHSQN
jgi:hypothetical protein